MQQNQVNTQVADALDPCVTRLWYWLYRINEPLPSIRKDFITCAISVFRMMENPNIFTCFLRNVELRVSVITCLQLFFQPSGPGFGEQFKKPTGSWECPTCMIQNKADVAKCVACETAKPGQKPSASTMSATQVRQGVNKTLCWWVYVEEMSICCLLVLIYRSWRACRNGLTYCFLGPL